MKINKCRSCNSENLSEIISLGSQYVSNFVKSKEEQGEKIPLELVLCNECKLLQLRYSAPDELMWNEQYWYQSGISQTIKNDLKDIVEKSEKLVELKDEDVVIDIGCNDGTIFEYYENKKLNLVGFEPCKNVSSLAKEKGFNVINNFFNAKDFKKRFNKAKLITAISMFYDLENPNKFLEDIKECLDSDGLFVIQQNYLVSMLEQNAFDNIVHEHREYYSFTSLKHLLEKHGFEIFDIELNDINGGSLRTYCKFKDYESRKFIVDGAEQRISDIEKKEKELELDTIKPYKEFADRILEIKRNLVSFLRKEKTEDKKIWIYGGSTRGNTSLQFFELDSDLIDGIADKNFDKHGLKTVGSLIPITSPEEMRKEKPDYLLINTWHFANEIINQEKEFFKQGGKFIVALPKFMIIDRMEI